MLSGKRRLAFMCVEVVFDDVEKNLTSGFESTLKTAEIVKVKNKKMQESHFAFIGCHFLGGQFEMCSMSQIIRK